METSGAIGVPMGGVGGFSDTFDLAPGAVVTYTISADLSASATGSLSNTANVSPPAGLTNSGTSASTDTATLVPKADLTITNTPNNSGPDLGTDVDFTATVTNAGPSVASTVSVNDLLPTGLQLLSSTPSVGTYDSTTGVWTVGTLASGASANLVLDAKATATGALTNTATVSSSTEDPNLTNNSATATVNVPSSVDLGVKITDADGGTYNPATNNTTGGTIESELTIQWEVTVTNNGTDAANAASLGDILGDQFSQIMWSVTNNGGASETVGGGTGNIDDTLTLPPGSSISFTIDAEPAATAGTVSDTVSLTPPVGLTNTGTSSSTDTVTIVAG
jgi:uncharacterized repeat protein (TIGR01451 family)